MCTVRHTVDMAKGSTAGNTQIHIGKLLNFKKKGEKVIREIGVSHLDKNIKILKGKGN